MEKGPGGVGRALENVWYRARTQTLAVISGQSIIVLDACFCPSQADGFPSLLSYAAWLAPHLQSSPGSSKRSLESWPYLGGAELDLEWWCCHVDVMFNPLAKLC